MSTKLVREEISRETEPETRAGDPWAHTRNPVVDKETVSIETPTSLPMSLGSGADIFFGLGGLDIATSRGLVSATEPETPLSTAFQAMVIAKHATKDQIVGFAQVDFREPVVPASDDSPRPYLR